MRPGPIPVDLHQADPSTEAGLKVAGQVKEIRRARHLSQRQLAGRMQVPRTYISKIENGKAIPTLGSLERLAGALGVDVRQLVQDARSRRDDEVASILADPLLAEIAALLPTWTRCIVRCFMARPATWPSGTGAPRKGALARMIPVQLFRRTGRCSCLRGLW